MMVEGVNFETARDISGKPIALRLNYTSSPARLNLKQIEPPPVTWQNVAGDFVERSHQALLKNEPILSWLRFERLIEWYAELFRRLCNPLDCVARSYDAGKIRKQEFILHKTLSV